MDTRVADPLVFSSAWVAAAAGALCVASGAAMGAWPAPELAALACCGTLVVYNVDRLRDLPQDQATAPERSAFVARNRRGLSALTTAAALLCIPLVLRSGPAVPALLAPVAIAGFLHRRLKRFAWWKPFYVSAAWTTVAVGLPAVTAATPRHVGAVAVVVGLTVAANVVASNLRDGEAVTGRFGARVALRVARGSAAAALAVAVASPAGTRPLLFVPLATLAALVPFRADERYGLFVVDGALVVGALLALPWLAG